MQVQSVSNKREKLLSNPQLIHISVPHRTELIHPTKSIRSPSPGVKTVRFWITPDKLHRPALRVLQVERPGFGVQVKSHIRRIRVEKLLVHHSVTGSLEPLGDLTRVRKREPSQMLSPFLSGILQVERSLNQTTSLILLTTLVVRQHGPEFVIIRELDPQQRLELVIAHSGHPLKRSPTQAILARGVR